MKFDIENALSRPEALEAIISRWTPQRETETVPIERSLGRVLAQDCHAQHSLPVHRTSAVDGIAVRSSDFEEGAPNTALWKRGEDFAQADTGDDFPDEFDSVIAIENVTLNENGGLTLPAAYEFKKESGIKRAGSFMQEGELLSRAGDTLTPKLMAILAAGGWSSVPVICKPKIAYIPTGNELVSVGTAPSRGQNIQTNSVMLRACFEQLGAEMIEFGIVPDVREQLGAAIDEALSKADIVIVNGGSSRGSEDYNSELLKERATYFSHGIKAVPGRPIGLAIVNGKPAINVPGPMIAAALAQDWLISGLIRAFYGQTAAPRVKRPAVLDAPLGGRPSFEHLARLVAREIDGVLHAAPAPNGCTLAQNIREVNAFAAVPAGVKLEAGQTVEIELLDTVNWA